MTTNCASPPGSTANAARFAGGIYRYAKIAGGTRKISKLLFDLGRAVANNDPFTVHERIFLAHLLNALSRGVDVREELPIEAPKAKHRKKSPLTPEVVREVDLLLTENPNKTAAYKEVGAIVGKDWRAIRTEYRRGKAPRKVSKR